MSLISILRLQQFQKCLIIPVQYAIQVNNYAVPGGAHFLAKKVKKISAVQERTLLPVETDINKLLTYCCGSNIYKEGEDVKLKPDSEYPEWLWNLRTVPASLDDLDPNTKAYWRRVRKMNLRLNNARMKHKKL